MQQANKVQHQQEQQQSPGQDTEPAGSPRQSHVQGAQSSSDQHPQAVGQVNRLQDTLAQPASDMPHVSPLESQQQLLQQLATQAGYQLLPPPGQSPVSAQAALQHAQPRTPVPGQLAYHQQQQQLPSPLLSSAGVTQGLDHVLSQEMMHQLGQGLQSSAMHSASMQQQQLQSRLPAWAQQALLPKQSPPVASSPHYGVQGLSPEHSMHAMHSPSVHHMAPYGQLNPGASLHEQPYGGSLRAPHHGRSWQAPAWQQQQLPDDSPGSMHWLDQQAQQRGSRVPLVQFDYSPAPGRSQYHEPQGGSPLDPRGYLPAEAAWAQGRMGLATSHPVSQHLQDAVMQQKASQAGSMQALVRGARQQGEQSELRDELSDGAAAQGRSGMSAQSSAQTDLGVAPILSGGSSGLSTPLRQSGPLESLMEVNTRVEAAMERAQTQLQAGPSTKQSAFCTC